MDSQRFDDVARILASGLSRRRALTTLARGALGGALGVAGLRDVAAACRKAEQPCNDANRCCPGSRCHGGRCKCKVTQFFFPCDGPGTRCVNVATSEQHCGGCDFATCDPEQVCLNGGCVDHCQSNLKDGDESDVDCGGDRCPKCGPFKKCAFDTHCESGHCDESLRCSECSTDEHCTLGSFDICVDHQCKQCRVNADCLPGRLCRSNRCIPHCDNNQFDPAGGETDVDCGGPCPKKCRNGQECIENRDCKSNFCRLSEGRCTDCGSDADCGDGKVCQEGVCVACASAQRQDGQVQAAQCIADCTNGIKDGDETDIDCGGPDCPQCAVEQLCDEDSDCETGHCGSYNLNGTGFRRRCAECFSDNHCPGDQICSIPYCDD